MPVGAATLNFSTSPEKAASVAVTGQAAIVAGSKVEAYVRLAATADHSIDEHMIENIKVTAGNIVAGTGFTIYGEVILGTAIGQYNIDWVWV